MKIAILGYGREGQSAYRYWNKPENELVVHDNNSKLELEAGIQAVLGAGAFIDLDSHKYDLLVRSPGLRLDFDKIKTPITTLTNEFMKQCPAEIIGITGTKGKGTTSTLIYEILTLAGYKTHLLGNIGTPALDILSQISKDDLVVYEMSSFQLFDIASSPHVAVCLVVTEDHLDWHASLEEYYEAKANIFNFQKPDDVAVYFMENEVSSSLALNSKADTKYGYGTNGEVYVKDDKIIAFGQEVIDTSEVALPGPHNLENACASICAVWPYTQDLETINKVLKTFTGLPYHIELIKEKDGVRIYNDSFSTNPTAASAAVKSFDAPLIMFLGGVDRGIDFAPVINALKASKVKQIICYGEAGQRMQSELADAGIKNAKFIASKDFKSIVRAGLDVAGPSDIVLFSPACASLDMFADYKSRGDVFNALVEELF